MAPASESETQGLRDEVDALRLRVAELEQSEARLRQADRELQKSEERYRVLVETMNDGLGVQDERGVTVYVNDALCRTLGHSRHELVGHPIVDIVDVRFRDAFRREVASCGTQRRMPFEIALIGSEAQCVKVLMSPVPILGPDGEYRGNFIVFTDITEHERAAEILERERNLLRTLMDNVPDYIYVKDTQSRFVTTNTAHLRVLGASDIAEVIGKTDYDFFPEALAKQYFADEQSVLSTGQALMNKVEQVQDRSGTARWMMTFKAPLRDGRGGIVGLIGVSRDITEMRKAEQALRESEDRFRLILENSRDVAYKFNLSKRQIEYISPSITQLMGLTSREFSALHGRQLLNLVHPEDRATFLAYLKTQIQTARPFDAPPTSDPATVEYRVRHRNGAYRWVGQSATIIRGADGRPSAEVGTIRDITESKNAEEAVRAASRMEATATLAGGIAHDFNNLMVGVLGNAELLQMRFADNPDATRILSTIVKSAQQAGDLAHQMLAFARGGKYQPRALNLNAVIAEALHLEEHSFPPRVRIDRKLDPHLWEIKADPVQMSQVIMNLSINAVEAISDAGAIVIRTENIDVDASSARMYQDLSPGCYVCLTVEDSGVGMDEDTQARVFEPFFTTKFQGRGLGLAAVYGIVKNHGGHVVVHSQAGHGTSFHVYLPAAEGRAAKAQRAAAATVGHETILLIDDEHVVLQVTREILERFGYTIVCARNGKEALDLARDYAGDIHAAILDMGMPVMGGAEAYPLLKRLRPDLKVVISSGYELDPAAQALLDAGASAFIHKPFRAQHLAAELRKALDS